MKKPKYVYAVIDKDRLIIGCFYSKIVAQKYADGSYGNLVQKLGVL